MTDSIILIIAILISGGIGAYLGMMISKLKSKGEQSTLEERNSNLQQLLNDLKLQADSDIKTIREAHTEQLSSLKESMDKLDNDKEDIRREKELIHSELTRKQRI